ncbi:hypothetical protein C8035_v008708 [Colletotrichum spinosum]|uniref:Uncharacterized protein n=1 Tax=Colletotrichum spinosum TaxID=1347390 RepID=A0A4R8PQJ6_9PEZI|nr:hypothetical protein C8035_v008708 [Colletotrichum spinosum]
MSSSMKEEEIEVAVLDALIEEIGRDLDKQLRNAICDAIAAHENERKQTIARLRTRISTTYADPLRAKLRDRVDSQLHRYVSFMNYSQGGSCAHGFTSTARPNLRDLDEIAAQVRKRLESEKTDNSATKHFRECGIEFADETDIVLRFARQVVRQRGDAEVDEAWVSKYNDDVLAKAQSIYAREETRFAYGRASIAGEEADIVDDTEPAASEQ